MAEHGQTIIIKKVKGGGGHGHHGGAWKVAYADFVTAMMAFFLLLWLLNSVTQEQLEGISNYFAPASIAVTTSGSGGMFGGTAVTADQGAGLAETSSPTVTLDLPPPEAGSGPTESTEDAVSEDQAEKVLAEKEEQQFDDAAREIRETLEKLPQLKEIAGSLVIDQTAEGLRVQVVDQEGVAMFSSGSATMLGRTHRAIDLVAKVIAKLPNEISITGHTDAVKYAGGETGYTNWELSADRANSTRRALIQAGVSPERLAKVVGAADQDPLVSDDPRNPRNRRIAIVLLRGTGQTVE
ncbi:MAG: flagellar motor protein MotB [Rhodospirillales bacterium]|jgi:chemotaxis protein MotB|nr:flagellar motor protein MotB [Rhodospirillales bacterium]